jgi:hypothetical protein
MNIWFIYKNLKYIILLIKINKNVPTKPNFEKSIITLVCLKVEIKSRNRGI